MNDRGAIKGKWFSSLSDEDFGMADGPYATRDEAVANPPDGHDGDLATYFTGRFVPHAPEINGEWLVEHLADGAYDVAGDSADGWPHVTRDQENELGVRLTAVLREWLSEVGQTPKFGGIEDIEQHEYPIPD